MKNLLEKEQLHSEISLQFSYSERVYKEYLKSGKKFIYASILRDINERIYNLIVLKSYILSEEIQDDLIALMFHLDVWRIIWKNEFLSQKPNLNSSFEFENDVNFPKHSMHRILNYLHK